MPRVSTIRRANASGVNHQTRQCLGCQPSGSVAYELKVFWSVLLVVNIHGDFLVGFYFRGNTDCQLII